ncbi:rna recognition motif-containing protein [Cystoisospora suis]|uniref:Rna recognition motif-containing protein n=1 Tax=Cystoisospora suis TaxID=483139 RepID=A0A2C6KI51_9APIC|nr:rna recognition motif-containing protein [Cystoisospora suis]
MRDDQQTGNINNPRSGLANKRSRTGCAFIRFAYKEEALFAIKQLNRKFVMPGSQRAMEVRFAENRRQNTSGAIQTTSRTSPLSRFSTLSGSFHPFVDAGGEGCVLGATDLFLSGEERNQLKQKQNSLSTCLAAAAASLGFFQKSSGPCCPAEGRLRQPSSKEKDGGKERTLEEGFGLPSWEVSGGGGASVGAIGGGGAESSFLLSSGNYALPQHPGTTVKSSSSITTTTAATSADHLASLARAALAHHLSNSCNTRGSTQSTANMTKLTEDGEGKSINSSMVLMNGSRAGGMKEGIESLGGDREENEGSAFMQLKEFLPFQSSHSSQFRKPSSSSVSWDMMMMMAGSGSRYIPHTDFPCMQSTLSISELRERTLNDTMLGCCSIGNTEASAASNDREESSSSGESGHGGAVLGDTATDHENNTKETQKENPVRGSLVRQQEASQKIGENGKDGISSASGAAAGSGIHTARVSATTEDAKKLLSSPLLSALKDDSGARPLTSTSGDLRENTTNGEVRLPQSGGPNSASGTKGQPTPNPSTVESADGGELTTLGGVKSKLQQAGVGGGGKGGKDRRWDSPPVGVTRDTSSRSLSPSNAEAYGACANGGETSLGAGVPSHEGSVQLLSHPPLGSDSHTNTGNAMCSDFLISLLPTTPSSPALRDISQTAEEGEPLESTTQFHHNLGKILWGQAGGCSGSHSDVSRFLPSQQGGKKHSPHSNEEASAVCGEANLFIGAASHEAYTRGSGGHGERVGVARTQSTSAESFDEGFLSHLLGGSFAERMLATSGPSYTKTNASTSCATSSFDKEEMSHSAKGGFEEKQGGGGGGKRQEEDTQTVGVYRPLVFPPDLLSHASSSSFSSSSGITGESREGPSGAGGAGRVQGSQVHGPPGANVFIFHIPNEWTEQDLLTHFNVYGPVVSARIASDRVSGRNRGFGFVSFSSVQAAGAAVMAMNGFQVNGKRLKVQIKKGEEQYASFFLPQSCGGDGGGSVSTPAAGPWSSNAYKNSTSSSSSMLLSSTDNAFAVNAWQRLFDQAPSSDITMQRGGRGDLRGRVENQFSINDSMSSGNPHEERQVQRIEDSTNGSSAVTALLQAAVALRGSLSSSVGISGPKSQQHHFLSEGCHSFSQDQKKRTQIEEDGHSSAAAAATAALVAALFSTSQHEQDYHNTSSSGGRSSFSSSSGGGGGNGRSALVGVGEGRNSFHHPNYFFHPPQTIGLTSASSSSMKGQHSLLSTLGKNGDHRDGLRTSSLEHHHL